MQLMDMLKYLYKSYRFEAQLDLPYIHYSRIIYLVKKIDDQVLSFFNFHRFNIFFYMHSIPSLLHKEILFFINISNIKIN